MHGNVSDLSQTELPIEWVPTTQHKGKKYFIYCVESKALKKWTGLRSQRTEPAFRIQYIRKMDQFACIINL